MKRFISTLVFVMLITASYVSAAESRLLVEMFDKSDVQFSLHQSEVTMLATALPSVTKIIAHIKESRLSEENLYIQFQLKDGSWRETAAGINGNAPVSWHIRDLIQDELKKK